MKTFFAVVCALFVLLAGGFPACAQSRAKSPEPSWEVKKADHFYMVPTYGGYSFTSGDDFKTGSLYGLRFGYQIEGEEVTDSLGIEGFVASIDTRSEIDNEAVTGRLFRLDAIYDLLKGRFVPFLSLGAGWLSLEGENDSDDRVLVTLGLGTKYALTDHFDVRADLRRAISFDPDEDSNWEYTVGLSYLFGKARTITPPPPPDSDRDGVPDGSDKCPGTARGSKVDRFGCPPDTDGDGVPDTADKCSNSPKGTKVDPSGCNPDTDGDGVLNDKDRCPDTPPASKVDEQGCAAPTDSTLFITPPVAPASTKDASTVVPKSKPAAAVENTITATARPSAAASTAAPAAAATAPVAPATTPVPVADASTPVADATRSFALVSASVTAAPASAAAAPASAATPASPAQIPSPGSRRVQEAPSPSTGPMVTDAVIKPEAEATLHIEFAFNRADIRPKYFEPLKGLAARLKASKEMTVEIEGHTDSIGTAGYNNNLSWRRVERVKRYLVKLGIEPKRIFTQGYGLERPVAGNESAEGRQRNRRAVVTIISEEP